jgi:hypothetical protein
LWLVARRNHGRGHALKPLPTRHCPKATAALSAKALSKILPELRRDVVTYDKAVLAAGFEHHSNISLVI